jgi:hypothetical protein
MRVATTMRFAATAVISATVVRSASSFWAAISITAAIIRATASSVIPITTAEPSGLVKSASPIISAVAIITKVAEAALVDPLTAEPICRWTEVLAVELFKPAAEAKAAIHVKRTVVRGMSEVKVIPRTYADEHAVHEVARTPVPIRRAAKRIRWIKPVFTYRWRIVNSVCWADLDPN